jgi:uncharacterized protein YukE
MGRLDRARDRLAATLRTWENVQRGTGRSWSGDARRRYDRQVARPLTAAVHRYASVLADVDAEIAEAMRLLDR